MVTVPCCSKSCLYTMKDDLFSKFLFLYVVIYKCFSCRSAYIGYDLTDYNFLNSTRNLLGNTIECNGSDQFECKSGQCISLENICDGTPECDDKSDETKETCLNIYCPGYTFKCDYGACVHMEAKCDGVKDCRDNSDEEDCWVAPDFLTAPKPAFRLPRSATLSSTPVPGTGPCVLPELPEFGQWTVIGGSQGYPKQKVSEHTVIKFDCNSGYKLSSDSTYLICTASGWSIAEIPKCLPKCPPLYSTSTTYLKCLDSYGIEIKCDEATHGASAKFTCAPFYETLDGTRSVRYCWNGNWNLPPPVCQPVCGEKRLSAQPLIATDLHPLAKQGDYPWATAIYHKIGGEFINVCGGSMLTQKVIITAAHCVTHDNGSVVPKEILMVGVGKYYKKFKDPRDSQAQYSEVEAIHVPHTYKGEAQRFASDIALLITKDVLLLSKLVQPVCYHDIQRFQLYVGDIGVVPAWTYTEANDSSSDQLQEIEAPYKSVEVCYQELPSDWADKYMTYDKMCAGYSNISTATLKGFSGAGLVFQNRNRRYYIHGIASIAPWNTQGNVLYTIVATHYDWIEKIISQFSF